MLFRLLVVCLSLVLSTYSFAQQTSIVKGSVVDSISFKPLSGVTILGENTYAVTDDSGTFQLKSPKNSTVFEVSHLGYASTKFKLNTNQSTPLVIKLKPSSTSLDEVSVQGKKPLEKYLASAR